MGLPALRLTQDLPDRKAGDRVAQQSTNRISSRRQSSLRAIIESVFDPDVDRVVYELPADRHREDDGHVVPAGSGLAVAAAYAEALARSGSTQFVVLVADGASWQREHAAQLRSVSGVRERFVILAPADEDGSISVSQLPSAGWRLTDLSGRSTARIIAKSLVEARYDRQPTLLCLDSEVIKSVQREIIAERPQSPSEEAAVSEAEATAIVAKELEERAAADSKVIPVVLTDHPAWQPLARFAAAQPAATAERLQRGLSIASAIANSGCRPVVVIDEAQLGGQRDALRKCLSRSRFRGTIIVSGAEWSMREPHIWPAKAEQHVFPSQFRPADVGRILSTCLTAERPAVLFLPRKPVVSADTAVDAKSTTEVRIPFAVSAQSAQSDQQEIEHKRLRLEALRWVQDYDRVGHRNLYLWRWCLHGIELTTFPGVPEEHLTHLHDTKLLSVILCVLFDDVADRNGRTELLETLIQSAGSRQLDTGAILNVAEREYVDVTQRLWLEYESRVRQYPKYTVYERLWRFDLLQFLNTMRYAHLVNSQPGLMNLAEHDVYTPHNMLMVSFSTLDLMCVAHFHTAELGSLREVMWHAQSMGRIGNVLSTWRRELAEADQSSGMFGQDSSLSMSSKEQLLLEKWRWHRSRCHAAAQRVASIDLLPVLTGHDRFFDMHLASSGRI